MCIIQAVFRRLYFLGVLHPSGFGWEEWWGGIGKSRKRGNCNHSILYEKIYIFNKKEKNLK